MSVKLHFRMQSNHKHTFRKKEGGISSKIIAKQWVGNYMFTQGGQIPKYDPKYFFLSFVYFKYIH